MNIELDNAITFAGVGERPRLLIVDDDVRFCRLISNYLSKFGYEIALVHDGLEAVDAARAKTWDAIVLDEMLPNFQEFRVLKKLREEQQVRVLMLTTLGAEVGRIASLELDADVYLPKTFSPRELVARIRGVLRGFNKPQTGPFPDQVQIGSLIINLATRIATNNGYPVDLTPVEFDLLAVLAHSKGRIRTREQLLNQIRHRNFDIYDRSIDVHISALRRKLNDNAKNSIFIRTIRFAGYMLINPATEVPF
jgi:DNA-binding response OmpR family regulator